MTLWAWRPIFWYPFNTGPDTQWVLNKFVLNEKVNEWMTSSLIRAEIRNSSQQNYPTSLPYGSQAVNESWHIRLIAGTEKRNDIKKYKLLKNKAEFPFIVSSQLFLRVAVVTSIFA